MSRESFNALARASENNSKAIEKLAGSANQLAGTVSKLCDHIKSLEKRIAELEIELGKKPVVKDRLLATMPLCLQSAEQRAGAASLH